MTYLTSIWTKSRQIRGMKGATIIKEDETRATTEPEVGSKYAQNCLNLPTCNARKSVEPVIWLS